MSSSHPTLSHLLDLLLDAVCVVDAGGSFVFVSAASQRIFGYLPDEMIGRPMIDFVWPDDRDRTLRAVQEIVAGEHPPHFENRYRRKDGRLVHIMWSAQWSQAHQLRVAVARDVTERKRVEAKQAALYAIADAALAAADVTALYGRVHRTISDILPAAHMTVALGDAAGAFTRVYGAGELNWSAEAQACLAEAVRSGKTGPSAASGATDAAHTAAMLAVPMHSERGMLGALLVQAPAGAGPYAEADRDLLQFVATQLAAAVDRKQLDAQLQHLAQHDALTDLPNRALLQQRLDAALRAARAAPQQLAVFYLDVDRFKQVNDTLGHAVGDLLLREVGRRLRLCVRGSDTVARIGGDEFVVLLTGVARPEVAMAVARKILDCMALPFQIDGHAVQVSASVGVALFPHDGADESQLVRGADEAMYRAKRAGGNQICLTSPS